MGFSQIKGNESTIAALRSMVDGGRVPHALLFYENPGCGGFALAQAYLQYLYCEHRSGGEPCGECPSCRQIASLTHPDVHYVYPVNKGDVIKSEHPISEEGIAEFRKLALSKPSFKEQDLYEALGVEGKSGNISVYEARDIIEKLSLSSLTGSFKTVVMLLPERMNIQAANKLLKILEEPPAKTVFLLITQNPQDVMPTIYSRCQGLRVLPSGERPSIMDGVPSDIPPLWDALLTALMRKNLSEALDVADEIDALKSREKQKAFFTYAGGALRNIFLLQRSLGSLADILPDDGGKSERAAAALPRNFCPRAISFIDKAAMLLGRNVSAKMIFVDLVNRLYMNL